MEITRQPVGETLHLTLKGRLDGAWSEHTGEALSRAVEEGWHRLDLDLEGVSFLSSAGIRVLVLQYKQLHKIQGRLSIVRASREVREVLEMAGLGMLATAPAAQPAAPAPAAGPRLLERGGLKGEVHSLCPGAALQARLISTPGESLRFPEGTLGFGLGGFGRSAEEAQGRLGEFLALAGAALTQPGDGTQTTDYLLAQGSLVPEVFVRSGLAAEGRFATLLRFDAREMPGGSVPLSALLELALELAGGPLAGFALAAETAALVGAALTAQPDPEKGVAFDFPEIRNRLLFTAEPAWAHTLSLVAGFVAAGPGSALDPLLRPPAPGSPLRAHVHAAAFPYRPLPKGVLEPGETVRQLLEEERPLGLLHLLNDWREPGGAGESRFYRGALWLSPLVPPPL